jgi:hypothetical protein
MVGVSVSRETKNPATFSGAGLNKTGFKLFSFALPSSRPYPGGVKVFNNECGYEAIRWNGNPGGTLCKAPAFFSTTRLDINIARGTYIETTICQMAATLNSP